MLLSISTVAMLAACSGEKRETAPEKETSRDTAAMEMPADTADATAATPPRAADKLFDDFIYAFMKNDRFQRDRIKFPLANYVDGRNRPIAEKQWKHDYMYSRDDIYTMIFDDEAALDAEKDTAVHDVTVEWVYLDKDRVKQYHFKKNNGMWQLVSLNSHALEKNGNSEFYLFYRRFVTDSTFQHDHISNPFAFSTYDSDNFENIEGVLDVDQWIDFRPELPQHVITNINYGQAYRPTAERILVLNSLSGGMNCTLKFSKHHGEWMLTRLEN